ncbi:hypothetical protein FRC02_006044 [Tulasnella sp. 418]|nr:hypothetical protein FRC02_006044 [Tulasnella sp. 418]
MSSSTATALCTPELLSNILELTDARGQVAAAQTCQFWSEQVFHWIWKNLTSILPIIRLFGDLTVQNFKDNKRYWVIPIDVDSESWRRLSLYGKYIQSIHHSDNTLPFPILDRMCFKIGTIVANRGPFFPNLRSLKWGIRDSSSLIIISLMISDRITDLDLDASQIKDRSNIPKLLGIIQGRASNITSFKVSINSIPLVVESAGTRLPGVLREMTALKELFLPQYFLSPEIVGTIGLLPNLKRLGFSDDCLYLTGHNEGGCRLRFGPIFFPVLETLHFNMALKSAAELFRSTHTPTHLQTILLATKELSQRSDLQEFIVALVGRNPGLQQFSLLLYAEMDAIAEPLHFSDLAPLLELRLKAFHIHHKHPIMFTPADVGAMGSAWSDMGTLLLNSEPMVDSDGTFPNEQGLGILFSFATEFQALVTLGVYLEVNVDFELSSVKQRGDSGVTQHRFLVATRWC